MNKLSSSALAADAAKRYQPGGGFNEEREFFNWLRAKFPNSEKFAIYRKEIKSPQVLVNGQNEYSFPILKADQDKKEQSVGLDQNDVFFPTHYALYLRNREITAINNQTVVLTNGQPHSYPNQSVFTANQNKVLWNLYSSTFSMIVGSRRFIDEDPVQQFLKVPSLQQGLAVSDVDPEGSLTVDPYSDSSIFKQLVPSVVLVGIDSIDAKITMKNLEGNALAFESIDADFQNVVELSLRGFLVKGGAQIVKMS